MGDRIRARRLQLKVSQEQLGAAVGVGKGMISAIEKGRYLPSVRVLAALGKELRCGTDILLYGAAGARSGQAALPGMSIEERINDLPEAMREFVLLSLARAENAKHHVPAQFLRPPTSENWPEFAAYLEAISMVGQRQE